MIENPTVNKLLEEIQQNQSSETQNPGGFQYSRGSYVPNREASAPHAAPIARPLPHQPKGRMLTSVVLLSVLGFGGYQLWNSFFRYAAYGIVAAHVVNVAAPRDGTVLYMHVREGDEVRQGQVIVTLHDLDAEHQLERISDQLRVAQANLSAEMARLHWQMQIQEIDNGEASAKYLEAAARLEEEVATQKEVALRLDRVRTLHERSAITHEQFEEVLYDYQGRAEKISRLREALKAWQKGAEAAEMAGKVSMEQIDPMLVRIDSLQGELRRVRESLKQGEVRSPVNGRIAQWHLRAGEFASKSDGLFSVVEEGSAHVELYLPQQSVNRFAVGDVVDLEILPFSKQVSFTVDRIGDDLENPPSQIERYYSPREKLLPVHLSLKTASLEHTGIPIGAQVRLASEWPLN